MDLQSIANCTKPPFVNTDNATTCTLPISRNITTYPSYFTCPDSTDYNRYCYIISNHEMDGAWDSGLLPAFDNCCSPSGVGGLSNPCVNFCKPKSSLEELNKCLANRGFEPSYNETGFLKATYCVQKDGDGGEVIKQIGTSGASGLVLGKGKAVFALFVLIFASVML